MDKLLQRQINRHLGGMDQVPESMKPFLEAVDAAYLRLDESLVLCQRSMDLMSEELTERNRALSRELAEKQSLIEKLAHAHTKLLQSEKMASIGQLAAGIAHEINNPIGYVGSNLNTLRGYVGGLLEVIAEVERSLPEMPVAAQNRIAGAMKHADVAFVREDIASLMAESEEGASRVRKIVQDLKDFSRADLAQDFSAVDLHAGLESTLNIVNNEIKYSCDVVRDYGELPRIECLGSQLNQVFMNLLINAAQATPPGRRGTITLSTGRAGEDEVWVEVKDDGCGIPQEHLNRIFDPFFTTKPVGTGTGLGLSLSYGIVEKHHGRIEVSSKPGEGTTFRVLLPVRQAA
ncbi:MAG: histidine kinase, partial [Zoogloea sp.]|nr:histidine kinase [Zoogloea sp.]